MSALSKLFIRLTWTIAMLAAVIMMPMPLARAANSLVQNLSISPDPFHTQIPGHTDQAKAFLSYDWDAGGFPSGEVVEVIRDSDGNVVYYWGPTIGADVKTDNNPGTIEKITLEWNGRGNTGTYNGQYVPDGTYTFYVHSHVTTPPDTEASKTFQVRRAQAPVLSVQSAPINVYYPSAGNFDLGYALSLNSATSAVVRLQINGPSGNNSQETVISQPVNSSGNYTISWNGRFNDVIAAPGQYTFALQAEGSIDGFGSLGNAVTGPFIVNAGSPPTNLCAGFVDVPANDADCAAFEYTKSIGALTGNPDGTLAPNSLLQRDQVAKIVLETFGQFQSGTSYCLGQNPFPDITPEAWSYQYICRGVALGVITGYQGGVDAGFYRPARPVNRAEFLALVLRNLDEQLPTNDQSSYADVPVNLWYSGYARYSFVNNLFTGQNLFPAQQTTRREVAQILYKLHVMGKI